MRDSTVIIKQECYKDTLSVGATFISFTTSILVNFELSPSCRIN